MNTKYSKKIDFKTPSNAKQMNKVQNIKIKVWKYNVRKHKQLIKHARCSN